MKVAVKGANVLIDLLEADLLGLWFRLGIKTHTTDLVVHEVRQPEQARVLSTMIQAGSLTVHALPAVRLNAVSKTARALKVSLADASAIALAEELSAILLSGDRRVRKEALHRGIEIRGLLWVLDEMILSHLLSPGDAAVRLNQTMLAGAFLPSHECQERHAAEL